MINLSNKIENDVELNTNQTLLNNMSTDERSEVTNCLALTIKKDYNLSIIKNVLSATLRNMWKVIASFFALNFFKFFL